MNQRQGIIILLIACIGCLLGYCGPGTGTQSSSGNSSSTAITVTSTFTSSTTLTTTSTTNSTTTSTSSTVTTLTTRTTTLTSTTTTNPLLTYTTLTTLTTQTTQTTTTTETTVTSVTTLTTKTSTTVITSTTTVPYCQNVIFSGGTLPTAYIFPTEVGMWAWSDGPGGTESNGLSQDNVDQYSGQPTMSYTSPGATWGAWGIYKTGTTTLDVGCANTLKFGLKGPAGNTLAIKVADTTALERSVQIVTTGAWQDIEIPLASFPLINWSSMDQLFILACEQALGCTNPGPYKVGYVRYDAGSLPTTTTNTLPTTTLSCTVPVWTDDFDSQDPRWTVRDAWCFTNNQSSIEANNLIYNGGFLELWFIKEPGNCWGLQTTGAELYTTTGNYLYGSYEVRMRPHTNSSGTISSFFLFRWDPWQEIDVEFLGQDTTQLHMNIYYNTVGNNANQDPHIINLGFDAAAAYHTYKIEWEAGFVRWYVDGTPVFTDTVDVPFLPMNVHMNTWSSTYTPWAGPLYTDPAPAPRTAYYDWVKYYPSCN